jgi:hypothetical protein
MVLQRLIAVLFEWLSTGRFPREEFHVHPAYLVLFALIVVPVMAALTIRSFG